MLSVSVVAHTVGHTWVFIFWYTDAHCFTGILTHLRALVAPTVCVPYVPHLFLHGWLRSHRSQLLVSLLIICVTSLAHHHLSLAHQCPRVIRHVRLAARWWILTHLSVQVTLGALFAHLGVFVFPSLRPRSFIGPVRHPSRFPTILGGRGSVVCLHLRAHTLALTSCARVRAHSICAHAHAHRRPRPRSPAPICFL